MPDRQAATGEWLAGLPVAQRHRQPQLLCPFGQHLAIADNHQRGIGKGVRQGQDQIRPDPCRVTIGDGDR